MSISDFFKNLFPADEDGPQPGETRSYELARSEEFFRYYNEWLSENEKKKAIASFQLGYESILTGNSVHELIEMPTQAMFIFNNENNFIDDLHAHFLIDYFRDKLLQNGYRLYFSDVRVSAFELGQTRKIFRHYVKVSFDPSVEHFASNPIFGNIHLELVEENKDINKIRITCNYHQQRGRDKEKTIHELVEFLVKE